MSETLESISTWTKETFGPCRPARVIARANEEMGELITQVSEQPIPMERIHEYRYALMAEAADVVIVLCQLSAQLGVSLQDAINAKMELNRKRVWKMDGTGCGYHVKGDTHDG